MKSLTQFVSVQVDQLKKRMLTDDCTRSSGDLFNAFYEQYQETFNLYTEMLKQMKEYNRRADEHARFVDEYIQRVDKHIQFIDESLQFLEEEMLKIQAVQAELFEFFARLNAEITELKTIVAKNERQAENNRAIAMAIIGIVQRKSDENSKGSIVVAQDKPSEDCIPAHTIELCL
jgi:hypothetical protein